MESKSNVRLVANDKKGFLVNRDNAIKDSLLVKSTLQLDPTAKEIPIPGIRSDILKLMVDFIGRHPEPHDPTAPSKWDNDFINKYRIKDIKTLYELLQGSDYMGIHELSLLIAKRIAEVAQEGTSGKTIPEIAKLLGPGKTMPEKDVQKMSSLKDVIAGVSGLSAPLTRLIGFNIGPRYIIRVAVSSDSALPDKHGVFIFVVDTLSDVVYVAGNQYVKKEMELLDFIGGVSVPSKLIDRPIFLPVPKLRGKKIVAIDSNKNSYQAPHHISLGVLPPNRDFFFLTREGTMYANLAVYAPAPGMEPHRTTRQQSFAVRELNNQVKSIIFGKPIAHRFVNSYILDRNGSVWLVGVHDTPNATIPAVVTTKIIDGTKKKVLQGSMIDGQQWKYPSLLALINSDNRLEVFAIADVKHGPEHWKPENLQRHPITDKLTDQRIVDVQFIAGEYGFILLNDKDEVFTLGVVKKDVPTLTITPVNIGALKPQKALMGPLGTFILTRDNKVYYLRPDQSAPILVSKAQVIDMDMDTFRDPKDKDLRSIMTWIDASGTVTVIADPYLLGYFGLDVPKDSKEPLVITMSLKDWSSGPSGKVPKELPAPVFTPFSQFILPTKTGGGAMDDDYYRAKYLKYKRKYLALATDRSLTIGFDG